jgi:hypothetical protein
VDDIPPSCPVYDVRYVYIYDWTPTYVYFGYLPGYFGCYPYYGTVVYGTGYRYRLWRRRWHYFPRPCTWGFYARYNPWLGRWSFGYSYWSGFLRVGYRWHRGPYAQHPYSPPRWFGPGGYRRPLLGPDRTPLRTPRVRRAPRADDAAPMNLYQRRGNVARVDREASRMPLRPVVRPPIRVDKPNNVFAGKDGKVYRRDETGKWRVNEGREWKPTQLPQPKPAKPTTPGGARPGVKPGLDWPRPQPQPVPARPAEPQVAPRAAPQPRPAPPTIKPAPTVKPAPPTVKPAPPTIKPAPGDLEREYRGRERGSAPPAPAKPTPPPKQEPKRNKAPGGKSG